MIAIAFAAYFVQILVPSMVYAYIGILFVCLLLLAFIILKLTEIRKSVISQTFGSTSILLSD